MVRHLAFKSYCVNLDRREDRWAEFQAQAPWQVERVSAIDGALCKPPAGWGAGRGAWGCYRTHIRILEDALNSGTDCVCIFEDDARFCEGFRERFDKYLGALPDDWGLAYLGGQHLKKPPERINDQVLRPYNVNRTHAYMVRGRGMLELLYTHLTSGMWKPKHHIDHHYGRLIERREHAIYAPMRWLVAQAAGKSNINGNENPEKWWQPRRVIDHSRPMVAVVGPFRGGTSCVAGTLHNLGVSMGHRFAKPNANNKRGFFEAQQLASICRRVVKEPRMQKKGTFENRVMLLRNWGYHRRVDQKGPHGGKHPSLCLLVNEVQEAWRNVKYIRVERPVDEVMQSVRRCGWWEPKEVIPRMIFERDRDLDGKDYLTVNYPRLLAEPEMVLKEMCGFLSYEPTPAQRQAALAFIDPGLKRL